MNYFWPKISRFLTLLGDLCLFYISLLITLLIRYQTGFDEGIWDLHWPIFSGLLVLWLIIFYSFNLYELTFSKRNFDFLNNYFKATILNTALGIIYFYILSPKTDISPKTNLIILVVIFSVFYLVWHKLLSKLTKNEKFYQNLLFIGYQPLIKELLPKSTSNRRFGFIFKGLVADNETSDLRDLKLKKYDISQLNKVIKNEKIDLLVINEPDNQKIINLLFQAIPLRVNFISLTNFYERITNRIPLKNISRGWFLENFSEGNKSFFEFFKRFIDLSFSIIFGVISFFLIPFIIIFIKSDSKGKIIFKQKRVGKDGKTFMAMKFRSMYENAEKNGAVWAKQDDPRITKIGKFLRKTRLDEIPQLWNILKGEMSFVGPRPERPEFIAKLKVEIPFYNERLLVKPGLTGWAQINFPYADSVESTLKKLQYDLYYIKHRSLILDLSIILKTLNIILKRGGR